MSAVQPCPWLYSKVIKISRNWRGILGNPSSFICHMSCIITVFISNCLCNIDKVISVSLRCCHARYVCPTFSSLTLTLSMSSLLSLVHTRPLVLTNTCDALTNTQHSSFPPQTTNTRGELRKKSKWVPTKTWPIINMTLGLQALPAMTLLLQIRCF